MRLADRPPGFCSVCFNADPERRYIDCEAAYDGAPILDRETQTIAILPWSGELGGHDDLYVCERCVKEAAELLAIKPELHARQRQEIRELELRADHWRAYAKRLEATLEERPEPAPRARRPRAVAA